MSRVGCEMTSGGRIAVPPRYFVAIHDERISVELATAANG
jgi:hypothetical protein